jgi:hypothetical protein
MTTTSPLDTQANQMADEFASCGYVGPMAKARFAQSIKPLLARLHAQATQLTLAQHFASENERLKQRVKELEKVVSAVYDGVAWRVAPNSDGIHMVAAGQMHKWRTILSAALSPNQNDGGMKI